MEVRQELPAPASPLEEVKRMLVDAQALNHSLHGRIEELEGHCRELEDLNQAIIAEEEGHRQGTMEAQQETVDLRHEMELLQKQYSELSRHEGEAREQVALLQRQLAEVTRQRDTLRTNKSRLDSMEEAAATAMTDLREENVALRSSPLDFCAAHHKIVNVRPRPARKSQETCSKGQRAGAGQGARRGHCRVT